MFSLCDDVDASPIPPPPIVNFRRLLQIFEEIDFKIDNSDSNDLSAQHLERPVSVLRQF